MRRQSMRGTAFRRAAHTVGILLTIGALAGCSAGSHPIAGTATPMEPAKPTNAAELMTKLRAVDPCSVFDLDTAKQYGPQVKAVSVPGNDLDQCTLEALTGDKPSAEFHITLGGGPSTGIDENGIHLDDPERTAGRDGTVYDRCDSYYPSALEDFGYELHTTLYTPPGQVPTASPQHACVAAKAMILAMRPALDRLAPVAPTLGQPSLFGKNPCRTVDQVARALPGAWHAGSKNWIGPYLCTSGLTDDASRTDVVVELRFTRNNPMSPDPAQARDQRWVTVAGLSGVEARQYNGGCLVSLSYRPESSHGTGDAHLIDITLSFARKGTGSDPVPDTFQSPTSPPFDSCGQAERVAPIVVAAAHN